MKDLEQTQLEQARIDGESRGLPATKTTTPMPPVKAPKSSGTDINVNDKVYVRLTQEGWVHYNHENGSANPDLKDFDGEQWVGFTLWDLMAIFGPEMCSGGPIMFVKNLIKFA